MPIYSFKCEKCHVSDERKLKIEERNEKQHCECGQELIRVLEVPSPPIFRGDGFTPRFHR